MSKFGNSDFSVSVDTPRAPSGFPAKCNSVSVAERRGVASSAANAAAPSPHARAENASSDGAASAR